MEPLDVAALNLTVPTAPPLCERWRGGSEGAVFHLANIFFFFGFTGGSSLYGLLYLFTLLSAGFFCSTLWAWSEPCSTDSFLWSLVLFGIVACSEGEVHNLEPDHCFAVEGRTAIDKLSVLLSGRVRVTVNGEFLHFIHPFQFLDSPEWDSLRPSEEGLFQVTLCADHHCKYVAWRRKKLYLLFAKHRYIARIFALVVRNDISEKLFSLNHRAVDSSGRRYDLRLPTYCHVPVTDLENTHVFLQVPS
ncbi:popeye domain-containing protein 3 isoform X2 [Takifugu rubripes]|uniref:popeye domain-containing protein 3-like isoform X2 n=1 Tax=Takifugu rubripes TaxID=31033 RepID=UPI0011456D9B|nr:popeye domain-containing protein 3-like isoform X2 [Takifugu rubripes]XP_029695300.1 popeye domain-containing protein 3 isoform X2 [Takifugu rubripes]